MKGVFGRHYIRSNFYNFVAIAFLATFALWSFGLISDFAQIVIGFILFVTDYLAEMYDPHPDAPGKWFATHFHRITDECSATSVKLVFGIFALLIVISIVAPAMYHAQGHCGSKIVNSIVSCV